MRSFLLRDKRPIIKWGKIPEEYYFEGDIPEGYSLAISPHDPYIIIDVDRHGDIDGFDNIPGIILSELENTLHYPTKNNGMHYWIKYTGSETISNKVSGLGLDIRSHKGYVRWYLPGDIRNYIHLVQSSSDILNNWITKVFYEKSK